MTNNEITQLMKPMRKKILKRFLLLGTLFILIAIIGGGLLFAQKVKQFRDKGPLFFMMEKITKELDLNDNQKAEVDKVREEIKAKMESKKKERETDFTEFENAFKQDKLDKQVLKDLAAKHDADREEMKEFFMDELIKFHSILTPEQRSKAIEKLKEMREKKDRMFHDGKFDGPRHRMFQDERFDEPPLEGPQNN
jgi:Spy/CpxP family protein refolding chaperone